MVPPTLTTLPNEIQDFIVELVAEQEDAWRARNALQPVHVEGEPRAHLDTSDRIVYIDEIDAKAAVPRTTAFHLATRGIRTLTLVTFGGVVVAPFLRFHFSQINTLHILLSQMATRIKHRYEILEALTVLPKLVEPVVAVGDEGTPTWPSLRAHSNIP